MARVLIPTPTRDFDPTEVAVSWRVLTELGHDVVFASPDGRPAEADEIMVTGRGLDPWGRLPGLQNLVLIGRVLRADATARQAYALLEQAPEFRAPIRWDQIDLAGVDGLLLPGGHRARGMREFLESDVLQSRVVDAFTREMPVAAICHGVLLVARSIDPATGRSVLYGRTTTSLTWKLERTGAAIGRVGRYWDPTYYRTYSEAPDQPAGYMSVQAEVTRALASAEDFKDVPQHAMDAARKTSGRHRDSDDDERPAFVIQDGNYVSARWPGDVHTFAKRFAAVLSA